MEDEADDGQCKGKPPDERPNAGNDAVGVGFDIGLLRMFLAGEDLQSPPYDRNGKPQTIAPGTEGKKERRPDDEGGDDGDVAPDEKVVAVFEIVAALGVVEHLGDEREAFLLGHGRSVHGEVGFCCASLFATVAVDQSVGSSGAALGL